MAKRKRRLPHGQLGKPIVLEIEDWRAIAKTSRIKLNPSVLARLTLATMFLAIHGYVENSAPSKAVFPKIEKLEKIITALRSDFPSGSDQNSKQFFAQLPEIQQYATRSREQFQQVGLMFFLELFSHVLMLNEKLVRMILKYATHADPLYVEGSVWDLWIIALTRILENAGLPTEARHDQENPSRFVIFVREIQARLPSHLYKKRSDDALAKAITRAREGVPTGANPDPLLFLLLGAFKPIASGQSHKFEVEPDTLREISEVLDLADKADI
jgi:hypothetical protein